MNNLEIYDPQENKWAVVTEASQDSKILSGIVKDQRIYLLSEQIRETQNGLFIRNTLFETTF